MGGGAQSLLSKTALRAKVEILKKCSIIIQAWTDVDVGEL
jgi:hypothetical protein